MRRFAAHCLIGLLSIATCGPALAASVNAPADEYFGRYHLSILGIRNAISDMTTKAHEEPEHASAFLNSAELAEDSIRQWQSRYPQDSWLPKTIFSLERLYVSIGNNESAEHAVQTAAWLDRSFPKTAFAEMGRTELASLSTSDDGNASTPDSPAMLGMVPALTDTTVPPSVDTPAVPVRAALATNNDGAATVDSSGPATELPSYAERGDAAASPDLNNPRAVDIWVRK